MTKTPIDRILRAIASAVLAAEVSDDQAKLFVRKLAHDSMLQDRLIVMIDAIIDATQLRSGPAVAVLEQKKPDEDTVRQLLSALDWISKDKKHLISFLRNRLPEQKWQVSPKWSSNEIVRRFIDVASDDVIADIIGRQVIEPDPYLVGISKRRGGGSDDSR